VINATGELDGILNVTGGAGSDTIAGGAGADLLTGGSAADTFRYTAISQSNAGNGDTIQDFDATSASEQIFLQGLLSGTFAFLGDETNIFTNTGNTEARFNDVTKILEIDTDGNAVIDMELTLTAVNLVDLDTADFSAT